jgi:hypothetical protein
MVEDERTMNSDGPDPPEAGDSPNGHGDHVGQEHGSGQQDDRQPRGRHTPAETAGPSDEQRDERQRELYKRKHVSG